MMRWLKVQQVRLAFIGEAVRDYLARVEAVERVQGPPSVRGVAVTLVNPNGTPTADEVRRIAARLGVTTEAAVEAASTAATGAGRTVETTAQHAPRPNDWQEGPTPVLGYGPDLFSKTYIREQQARIERAQCGECGDGPPCYEEWSR